MRDEEFEQFVTSAVMELEAKQAVLIERWGIGTFARFLFDQPSATLQFIDSEDHVRLGASVIPIGSYSMRSNSWKWCWANESFLEPLRSESARLRELGALTGFDIFSAPIFTAEPKMADELAAMSVRHLQALGCYRAPGDRSDLYLAIMALQPWAKQ